MAKRNNKNKQLKNRTDTNNINEKIITKKNIHSKEHLEELSNNIDITTTTSNIKINESIQENNTHVKPSSSRDEVEVDKIFKLLQEAKDELKSKNTFKKDRQERIEQIISDIPKNGAEELSNIKELDNIEKSELTEEDFILTEEITETQAEQAQKPSLGKKAKKESHIINYLLLMIIFILVFLLYDNNKLIKLTSNKEDTKTKSLKFSDLPQNLRNEYIPKHVVVQAQEQTKDLIEKSQLLITQNKLLETKIKSISLEKDNKIIMKNEQKVKNNRNLLKELTALKNEQSIYSNKVVALNIEKKKNQEKLELLVKENKLLEKSVQDFKMSKEKQVLAKEKAKTQTPSDKYQKILNKEVFPAIKSTSTKYEILKCYDLQPGEFYLSSKCKNDISKFASTNSKALRFEIIGVVDQTDFTSLYKEDTTSLNALELQKYNAMGLARYRVLETSWFLSTQLKDIILTPVNYTITSKKTNRGSIIRAYYK
ncbi:hypothetical protein A9Q76_05695 [Arcobacter sp. 31_11_sub10_T18]|nr:hypothetical protein A9Q76_05695 [Arcobacter sp. 31_11_sub10_T18]